MSQRNLIFIIAIPVLQNHIFLNFTERQPYLKKLEEFEFKTKLKFTKLCVGFPEFYKKKRPCLKSSEEFEFSAKLKFTKLYVGFSQFH